MKNYNAYESGWIETTKEEIHKLQDRDTDNVEEHQADLSKLKNYYHAGFKRVNAVLDIVNFSIREAPCKKDRYDRSVLLCVRLANGDYLAKKHNNSQWLNLNYV